MQKNIVCIAVAVFVNYYSCIFNYDSSCCVFMTFAQLTLSMCFIQSNYNSHVSYSINRNQMYLSIIYTFFLHYHSLH